MRGDGGAGTQEGEGGERGRDEGEGGEGGWAVGEECTASPLLRCDVSCFSLPPSLPAPSNKFSPSPSLLSFFPWASPTLPHYNVLVGGRRAILRHQNNDRKFVRLYHSIL